MAPTLHLLICLSAAMTASGGYKYPFRLKNWHPEMMPFPPYDRMDARSADGKSENVTAVISRTTVSDSGAQRSTRIMNSASKPATISRRTGSVEDRVQFPGPTSRNGAETPVIPENCQKQKLCGNVPDYPVEQANAIIESLGEERKFLPMDELDASDTPEISHRAGDVGDNQELCESYTQIINPLRGLDKFNKSYNIVNNKENPVQGVRVEICTATEVPCKSYVCFQSNYKARCVQKFTYRPLLVFEGDKQSFIPIAVPSCCACLASIV